MTQAQTKEGLTSAAESKGEDRHVRVLRWTRCCGQECDLPVRTWLKRVWKAVRTDNCDDLAAQISYFFLIALFPFFVVLAAIVGYLPFTGAWPHVLTWITHYFPDSVQPYVFQTVTRLTQEWGGLLSFGLVSSIWIATRAVISLMDGLNTAYNVRETRSFWRRRFTACGVMLVLAFTFLVAFGLLTFGGSIGHRLGTSSPHGAAFLVVWHVLRWVISLVLLNFAVTFANYVLPNAQRPWRWVTPGSLFVVAVWFPATIGFNAFLRHFGGAGAYGALGAFFVLMTWVYMTNFILLVAAEMDSELEKAARAFHSENVVPRMFAAS
ncbi:MAG TPA: YihY/virulence factor BrkB family protein [Terriglobia bacterium]|nr:YihY/virulence factor BrkB family protein [Terriglobia bacterium]